MAKFRSILLIPFLGALLAVSGIGSNLFSIAQDISVSTGTIPNMTEGVGMAYYTGSQIEYKTLANNWINPIIVYVGDVDELEAIVISNIVHVVFTDSSNEIFHCYSMTNATFSNPLSVDNGEDISITYWDGSLTLAFSKTISATNSEIFMRRYMGAVWQSASQISNYVGRSIHPYITTFGAGVLYVVWEDYRRGLALPYGRSTSDGTSWTDESLLIDPNIKGAYPHLCSVSGISYLITLSDEGLDIYPGDVLSFTERVTVMEDDYDSLDADSDYSQLAIVVEKKGYLYAKLKNAEGWTANMNLGLGTQQNLMVLVGTNHLAYKRGNDVLYAKLEMGEVVESGAIPPSSEESPEFVDAYPLEYQELGGIIFGGDIQETYIQIIDALPLPEGIKKILRGTPWYMVIILGFALMSAITISVIVWNRRRYGSVLESGNKIFKRKKKNTTK